MSQRKTKAFWVAGGAVAGVLAIGTTVIVTVGSGSGGDSATTEAVPRPSGPLSDYPARAPEYSASDCEPSELVADSELNESSPEAVSPSGEYIAGAPSDTMWGPDDDTLSIDKTVQKQLDGIHNPHVVAVNSRGMLVGDAEAKSGKPNPGWVYYDGESAELTLPDRVEEAHPDVNAVEVHIIDVNESGDIAGFAKLDSDDRDGGVRTEQVPLRWEAGASEGTVLEASGDGAQVGAITEDGSVIGTEFDEDAMYDEDQDNDYGDVWEWGPDGKRETLPVPAGEVEDVAGEWLLVAKHDGEGSESYRWNMTTDNDVEEVSVARAIDSAGQVVGSSEDRAFVETDSGREELPIPEDAYEELSIPEYHEDDFSVEAVGTNNGVITGSVITGEEEQAESTPIVWHCAET